MVRDLSWLPDGRIVYPRRETLHAVEDNLWQINVDRNGKPTGQPVRMTQWVGSLLSGLSASADGKGVVFVRWTMRGMVYLGDLTAGGTRLSTPRLLTNDETSDRFQAWTTDSQAVLFSSPRNGRWGLFRQGVNQENAVPVFTGQPEVSWVLPSPDGAWILNKEFSGPGDSYTGRLMRIPSGGGPPQFVLPAPNLEEAFCAYGKTKLCVLYEGTKDKKQAVVTAFDALKGRGKVLRTLENDPLRDDDAIDLSADGSTLALVKGGAGGIHILLLSLTGGADREISVKSWSGLSGAAWTTDGKGLYCGFVSPQGSTLLYVDLKGKTQVLLQTKETESVYWGMPSPDGRYLAIIDEIVNSNVWMLKGF